MQTDGGGCIYEYKVKVNGGLSECFEASSLADLMFILVSHSLVCVTPRIPKPVVLYSVRKPLTISFIKYKLER